MCNNSDSQKCRIYGLYGNSGNQYRLNNMMKSEKKNAANYKAIIWDVKTRLLVL